MAENGITAVTGQDIEKLMGILNGFKGQYSTLSDDFAKYGKAQGETAEKLGKLTDDMISLQTKYADAAAKRLDALEEKANRAPASPVAPKSIGQLVIEDAGFLAGIKQKRFGVTIALKGPLANLMHAKDITTISQSWPQMVEYIASTGRPPFGVRALVPGGRTSSGAIEYIEETSFTNAAAVVAEGAAKPKIRQGVHAAYVGCSHDRALLQDERADVRRFAVPRGASRGQTASGASKRLKTINS